MNKLMGLVQVADFGSVNRIVKKIPIIFWQNKG